MPSKNPGENPAACTPDSIILLLYVHSIVLLLIPITDRFTYMSVHYVHETITWSA